MRPRVVVHRVSGRKKQGDAEEVAAMRSSVMVIKRKGITCVEFMLTLLTLVILNAIIILPVARLVAEAAGWLS